MPIVVKRNIIRSMIGNGKEIFVLDEFRLRHPDTDGATAALVRAGGFGDSLDPIPLLTSIDDARDVANVRTVPAGEPEGIGPRGDVALGHLVSGWKPVKRFVSRIAARTEGSHMTSFRLAVTESGINKEVASPPARWPGQPAVGDPVSMLLIGVPVGTHAGLLVLVGRDAAQAATLLPPTGPPAPLASELGVRVYEA